MRSDAIFPLLEPSLCIMLTLYPDIASPGVSELGKIYSIGSDYTIKCS